MKSLPWTWTGLSLLFLATVCLFPWDGLPVQLLAVLLACGGLYCVAYGTGALEGKP